MATPNPNAGAEFKTYQSNTTAPAWWKGYAFTKGTKGVTPQEQYAMIANALLPHLSAGNQSAVAKSLAPIGDAFKGYGSAAVGDAQAPVDYKQLASSQRATSVLDMLERMRTASGLTPTEMGAGYNFLSNAAKLLQKTGGTAENGMNRASFSNLMNAYSGLRNTAGSEQYGSLGDTLFNFGNVTRKVGNNTIYGDVNKRLIQ